MRSSISWVYPGAGSESGMTKPPRLARGQAAPQPAVLASADAYVQHAPLQLFGGEGPVCLVLAPSDEGVPQPTDRITRH